MRTLTNDYRDAKVLDLSTGGERGPYLVTQTGVSPRDPNPRTHMFVLRPDGRWVDFNAYACQGKPELMDELVFPAMTQVMQVFARLAGPPLVVDLPVDENGLKAWVAKQEGRDALESAKAWASEYKKRRREKK